MTTMSEPYVNHGALSLDGATPADTSSAMRWQPEHTDDTPNWPDNRAGSLWRTA